MTRTTATRAAKPPSPPALAAKDGTLAKPAKPAAAPRKLSSSFEATEPPILSPGARPTKGSGVDYAAALAQVQPVARPGLPADWAQRADFVEWHFTAMSGEKFTDVAKSLDELKARGVTTLHMYAPFHGDPKGWNGCAPIDLLAPTPRGGSLEDFRALVQQAHAKGIAVTMYLTLIYVTEDAPLFKQAVADKAAGKDTAAARSFIWADTKADTKKFDVAESGWKYSAQAKAWYATSWKHPALNFGSKDGVEYAAQAVKLWGGTGVDGFVFDAPNTQLAMSDADRKFLLGDLPEKLGVKLRFPEGQPSAALQEFQKYNINFGIFGEDDDNDSLIEEISRGEETADELEATLVKQRDYATAHGGGVTRLAVFNANERTHLFNAAVMAGNGVHVDLLHSVEKGDENTWVAWSKSRKDQFSRLMRAITQNPAQAAAGGRQRLSTGADPQHYAVKRTSLDGRQVALNVFNFKKKDDWVTVDLRGSGLALAQTPVDTFSGKPVEPITSGVYRVKVPAQGFLLLDVKPQR